MRSSLAFLFVLLGFVSFARSETPPANKFEKEILAYEEKDKTSMPPKGGILFTGASGIRRWTTLTEDFPGLPVFNRGFGGSQLSDSIHYVDRISIKYAPKTIVIQAGGNDINAGKTPEQVFADFKTYVEKVRAALPEVKIIFLNLGPSPKRWEQREAQQKANQLVRDYIAAGKNLVYVDLWPGSIGADGLPKPELYVEDKLHSTAAGYKMRTELLRPLLP
jgi:hypothetical protein